jgi:hypothetical protein
LLIHSLPLYWQGHSGGLFFHFLAIVLPRRLIERWGVHG